MFWWGCGVPSYLACHPNCAEIEVPRQLVSPKSVFPLCIVPRCPVFHLTVEDYIRHWPKRVEVVVNTISSSETKVTVFVPSAVTAWKDVRGTRG